MADEQGPGLALLWFVGIGALVILGLIIAAQSHHASVEFAGIMLAVVSVLGAFKLIVHLQDRAWHGSGEDT